MDAQPTIANCPTEVALLRGRPMFQIGGLTSVLDKNQDQILHLIEEGELLWAFDLSLVPERTCRRELRVLPACVEQFRAGQVCRLEWDDVARLLTPHDEPFLTGLELQRSLNVSSSHLTALIRRKLLENLSQLRPGPNGSARVPRESFLRFIKERRYF